METNEVIQATIDKMLDRVDALASKLGIATKEIWRFSVSAKAVEARRDTIKSAALLLVVALLWGWSIRVSLLSIPHKAHTEQYQSWVNIKTSSPCDEVVAVVQGRVITQKVPCTAVENKSREIDEGISTIGWMLIASGVLTGIIGLLVAIDSVSGFIDGLAACKTAEYNAYQNLINDMKQDV